ncbi:hypothetical protein EPA93_03670 [Ktedonosporobacter rubrisoli]|uniref:Uncharacterized protein n=1 Tax=Ktedonosporobacter rubrisoli TaxID=2509675 RepID=A0A4P6JJM7_KTERU|nr:hypothetical protein [Ktedonosporobacter rubrisoli]QBD75142.1 hypothetical protein EPA93_03670 [Ktedonosporobacter rubrisoli]
MIRSFVLFRIFSGSVEANLLSREQVAICIQQASLLTNIGIVVHDVGMRVERDGVKLAIMMSSLSDGRKKAIFADANLGKQIEVDGVEKTHSLNDFLGMKHNDNPQ